MAEVSDPPECAWIRCPACRELLYTRKLQRNLGVCPLCGEHGRLTARQRIAQLVDDGSFLEFSNCRTPEDPLGFTDSIPYTDRLSSARADTGEEESVLCGSGEIIGQRVVVAVMDFRFLGGSLGSGAGERLTMASEYALNERLPMLFVTASGGARMQEGCLSLMQMAKVSQVVARLHEAGVLTATLVTDPTYGGVAASFATQSDVILAEPGARLGFAGPRVIKQTIRAELPADFQTAEHLLACGLIDQVASRFEHRELLADLFRMSKPVRGATAPILESKAYISDSDLPEVEDVWEVVQRARDPERPTTRDYLNYMCEDWRELHGDRLEGDSPTIIGGLASIGGRSMVVVGNQKGHTTAQLLETNFGMAEPSGFRKASRLFSLAERLHLPLLTLVNTPGAYPGVAAEQRGQAFAIAECIRQLTALSTPVVSVITGEGGSGGALALAVGDRVLMAENSIYSVISPEGCAAILDGVETAPVAAERLQLTPSALLRLGIVDGMIPEPVGSAQASHDAAAERLRGAILLAYDEVEAVPAGALLERRRQRLRELGGPSMPSLAGRTSEGEVA